MIVRTAASAFALLVLLAAPNAHAATTVLDDFESASAPSPWTFYDGSEFPGATGSIGAGPGHAGHGLELSYDLTQGGNYVAANLALTVPVAARAIGFWARSFAGPRVVLRVTDDSGQTLQYGLARPLSAMDPDRWYEQVVDLTGASDHWGGSNDGALHGSVHSIALLADRGTANRSLLSGTMSFDDVVAYDAVTSRIDPFGAIDSPAPDFGDFADGVGANIHFTQDDRALDALQAAGFSLVRMDLAWSAVERTAGQYDFGAFDELVSALQARAMSALFILDYGNPLYDSGNAPSSIAGIAAFGAYCQAAANHFNGKPVRFEVWNEPNLSIFWKPTASAEAYANLLTEAIARVHRGNPAAEVSTGGLSGFDFDFLSGSLSGGAGAGAAAVGVHPYRQTGPEGATDELLLLRTQARDWVPKAAAWDTEWGYSSTWFGDGHDPVNRQRQAVFAVREIITARALGFPLAIYYDVRDDGTAATDPEHNFGLLANDYSDKPAMVAVRTLLQEVRGRAYAGVVRGTPAGLGLHTLRFDGQDDVLLVIWRDAPGGSAAVALPAPTRVRSMLGGDVAFQTGADAASLTVNEADGPIHVTLPRPAASKAGCGCGMGDPVAVFTVLAPILLAYWRRRRPGRVGHPIAGHGLRPQ